LLHLEFMIHAARNPHLSKQLGERMSALRLEIERYLTQREGETHTALPLPAADLALILRALGIGLAVEALNQPDKTNPRLYGDLSRSWPICSRRGLPDSSQVTHVRPAT
jgi:hypothetical protein